MLDADNTLYPGGLECLVAALDNDREADVAYGMLETFAADGPIGLASFFPLGAGPPSNRQFHRRARAVAANRLRALGGFTTDIRLHGWEN